MGDLLHTITDPADLRRLERSRLPRLAAELRDFMLENVSRIGGHLSPGLGVVELGIALHYVFDTPHDRVIWDVGHQTYAHKTLTGRRDRMHTMRQPGGLSGFPVRTESAYDAFGTAHSSTSISAALGMAIAAKMRHEERHSIAVIGDGAMTAGMAFEAMNNAGIADGIPFIVILNDNDMSISAPVGALNRHLARLASDGTCATLFEELGFNYNGPIDGNDLDILIPTLQDLKQSRGPQLLHVMTKKGKGYARAEADPVRYHSPGKFSLEHGITPPAVSPRKTYSQVFGEWLCDAATQDSRVVGITPAMREGSGMAEFEARFPDRYFDVGIAEQHAVTFAAGLAAEGLRPVVAIYSTFLQRAYDQLIHDVALQNLPVVFAIDRAGLVGADGATHHGAYDLAFLRCIPNMTVMAASDENECRQMLHTALQQPGPAAVRYPRGAGLGVATTTPLTGIPMGKGELRRGILQQSDIRIAILAFGSMVEPALAAAELVDATVANMRFVKPLDIDLIHRLAATHDAIVTIEEGCILGGAGSACMEAVLTGDAIRPVLQLGFPDHFIDHGDPARLLAECGLDAAGIARAIRAFTGRIDQRRGQ